MKTPISIIIPTYTASEYLNICLNSIYQNQYNQDNEIVIVVDGTYHLNKEIISQYKDHLNIKLVVFEENKGLSIATNYGFYNAINKYCLLINDDNVAPYHFDKVLLEYYKKFESKIYLVPNQIEPNPSIFKPFVIKNFGKNYKEFNLIEFTEQEQKLRQPSFDLGWTLPIFIERNTFIAIGGWDIMYNSAHVVDWDFFMKLDKLGYSSVRIMDLNFYHFGSQTARTSDSFNKEYEAHQFYYYKWGFKSYNKLLLNQ